jgi:hypothetical protein
MERRGGATDADIAAVSDDQATATIPHVTYPGCGITGDGGGKNSRARAAAEEEKSKVVGQARQSSKLSTQTDSNK